MVARGLFADHAVTGRLEPESGFCLFERCEILSGDDIRKIYEALAGHWLRPIFALKRPKPIMERLIEWCAERNCGLVEPELPSGIIDRNADCWEPLLVVADEAGGDWPERGRAAAIYLTDSAADENLTPAVELRGHIKFVFADEAHLATTILIDRLCGLDESPYRDIRGKPMDSLALAKKLKAYGIKSRVVRIGDKTPRGYVAADFHDAWGRYLPS